MLHNETSPAIGLSAKVPETEKSRELGTFPISERSVEAETLEKPLNINARGGGPLDTAPAETVPEIKSRDSISGLENGETEPFRPISTPEEVAEATAHFKLVKGAESPDQKRRANKEHGRVFSLMQFQRNAKTGEVMYTQEQLDAALTELQEREILEHYAYIWQTKDRYNEIGAEARRKKGYGDVQPGDFVAPHLHGAIMLHQSFDLSVRQVSDIFEMPQSRVTLGGGIISKNGDERPKGPGSAKWSFLQLVQYMTHERVWGDHSQADGIPSWERGQDD